MDPARPFGEESWPAWLKLLSGPAGMVLARLDLAGLREEDAQGLLAPEERRQLASFALEKRRRQWLGGRLAAKWAAARYLGEGRERWPELAVVAGAGGAPRLRTPARAALPFLSISHSGGVAAAMAADLPCGLDVQEASARILAVRPRFVLAGEESLLAGGLPPGSGEKQAFLLLWAAKEAVRKMSWQPPLPSFFGIRLAAVACAGAAGEVLFSFAVDRPGTEGPQGLLRVLTLLEKKTAWAFGCRPQRGTGSREWSS